MRALELRADDESDVLKVLLSLGLVHLKLSVLASEHHSVCAGAAQPRHQPSTLTLTCAQVLLNLGISHTSLDEFEEAEAAFRRAAAAAPKDGRPALSLGRLLTKLTRPAEAIEQYYFAALKDPDLFDQVKAGLGTAKAQQGRLAEATENFESAHRMDPANEKLKSALAEMASTAEALAAKQEAMENAVGELCGTPCQEVVDTSGVAACAATWVQGCGEEPPPAGFTPASTVAELCAHACAFHLFTRKEGAWKEETSS